jgi:hypothetical protein
VDKPPERQAIGQEDTGVRDETQDNSERDYKTQRQTHPGSAIQDLSQLFAKIFIFFGDTSCIDTDSLEIVSRPPWFQIVPPSTGFASLARIAHPFLENSSIPTEEVSRSSPWQD